MGNETSAPADPGDGSVSPKEDDDEMPFQYASFSVQKDRKGPAATTKVGAKRKNSAGSLAASPEPELAKNRLITVSRGATQKRNLEPALEALGKIPPFYPILKSSIGAQDEDVLLAELDADPAIKMCSKYQNYLKGSALEIQKRQSILGKNMKWIDKNAAARCARFNKTHRAIAKHATSLQQVETLSTGLRKVMDAIHEVTSLATQLNNMLPEDQRLEPFQFSATLPTAGDGTPPAAVATPRGSKEAIDEQEHDSDTLRI